MTEHVICGACKEDWSIHNECMVRACASQVKKNLGRIDKYD